MSNTEIVIKTEVVKVDELEGREKQIYDAGVVAGYNAALDKNLSNRGAWMNMVGGIGFFIAVLTIMFRLMRGY